MQCTLKSEGATRIHKGWETSFPCRGSFLRSPLCLRFFGSLFLTVQLLAVAFPPPLRVPFPSPTSHYALPLSSPFLSSTLLTLGPGHRIFCINLLQQPKMPPRSPVFFCGVCAYTFLKKIPLGAVSPFLILYKLSMWFSELHRGFTHLCFDCTHMQAYMCLT